MAKICNTCGVPYPTDEEMEARYAKAEEEFFGLKTNSKPRVMGPRPLPEGYELTAFGNVIPPKGTANKMMKKHSSGPGLCPECRRPLSGS